MHLKVAEKAAVYAEQNGSEAASGRLCGSDSWTLKCALWRCSGDLWVSTNNHCAFAGSSCLFRVRANRHLLNSYKEHARLVLYPFKKNKNKKVYQIWKTIGWKHQKLTRNQRHNSARIHSCLRLACVLPATGSYTLHHMREGWGKDFLHKHSLMTPHQASLPGWMLQPTWACGFSVFYLRLQATLRTVEHPGKWLV